MAERYELDGGRYIKKYGGNRVLEIDNNYIKKYGGNRLLEVERDYVKKYGGSRLLEVDRNSIKKYGGSRIGEIKGETVTLGNGAIELKGGGMLSGPFLAAITLALLDPML